MEFGSFVTKGQNRFHPSLQTKQLNLRAQPVEMRRSRQGDRTHLELQYKLSDQRKMLR